jgi:hypothetical protein
VSTLDAIRDHPVVSRRSPKTLLRSEPEEVGAVDSDRWHQDRHTNAFPVVHLELLETVVHSADQADSVEETLRERGATSAFTICSNSSV